MKKIIQYTISDKIEKKIALFRDFTAPIVQDVFSMQLTSKTLQN